MLCPRCNMAIRSSRKEIFEIQITKVLGQKCRRLNVCPQILINWSGTDIGVITFKNSIPIQGRICKVTVV